MLVTPVDMTDKTTATVEDQEQWTTGLVLKVTGIGAKPDRFDSEWESTGLSEPVYRVGRVYDDLAVVPVPNAMLAAPGSVTGTFLGVSVTFDVTTATKPDDYDTTAREDVDTHQPMLADALEKLVPATSENSGLMSAEDKAKLDGISETGGDEALTTTEIDAIFDQVFD